MFIHEITHVTLHFQLVNDIDWKAVVDADADIMGDFSFDYIPPMSSRKNTTFVWSARNPINDCDRLL